MTDYEEIFAESSDRLEIYETIIDVGKESLKQFEPQVRSYLDHEDEELVGQAAMTLGLRWSLPEFKDEAERMWRSSSSAHIRESAFLSWASYSTISGDQEDARVVREIVGDDQYSPRLRGAALSHLSRIFEMKPRVSSRVVSAIGDAESSEQVNSLIPWDLVNEICEEFGIEVVG